jgi:hypothetical protein
MDRNSPSKKLINNLWIVGESVSNKYTNGFTDEQSTPKKFTRFILLVYSSIKLLSVIYGLSVSPLVINIPMDLQTNKAHQKNLPTLFYWYIHR